MGEETKRVERVVAMKLCLGGMALTYSSIFNHEHLVDEYPDCVTAVSALQGIREALLEQQIAISCEYCCLASDFDKARVAIGADFQLQFDGPPESAGLVVGHLAEHDLFEVLLCQVDAAGVERERRRLERLTSLPTALAFSCGVIIGYRRDNLELYEQNKEMALPSLFLGETLPILDAAFGKKGRTWVAKQLPTLRKIGAIFKLRPKE